MKNSSKTKESLIAVGFSQHQADVYVALLKLGRATVSEIGRMAGINRTTGYDILDSLVEKGLVSISGKKPKQEYVAESPERIGAYLETELKRVGEQKTIARELIPELTSIHNVTDRPKVMFYEGKEGLERVYEDTLTSQEPIRAYANFEDMHAVLPNYFPQYYKRRTEKNITIRGIVPGTPAALERAPHATEEARDMALVPADQYHFSPEIDIYDDKVMIASWKEKLGIIIQSKEIAEAMKSIYELAWAESKRLDVTERAKVKKEIVK